MDHKSHFDLSQATQTWLSQLEQRGTFTKDDLRELQSHLLDGMDALQATGLSQQEAFLVATHRVGPLDVLAEEFGKLDRPAQPQRESVLLLLGVISFMLVKNTVEMVSECGAVALARYLGDSFLTSLLDMSLSLLLLCSLSVGVSRWFNESGLVRSWLFTQLNQRPIRLIIGMTVLLGGSALGAYLGHHQFEALVTKTSTERWTHSEFGHVHGLFWLGFYLVWLLMLFQVAIGYLSAGSQTLLTWLRQASLGWLLVAGLGLFSCCLGISIMGMRILAPVDGTPHFYVSAGLSGLLSALVLSRSLHYSFLTRLLVSVTPLLIWYLLALGTTVPFEEKPSRLLEDLFPVKFIISGLVGGLIGLFLGSLSNRRPVSI
ncbi:permease prefix domain 1-containing protein [Spirosoma linguale]|uniref:Uncharacterized protein n=1 Tax=Spirosoma linguale (strain ATCC 33905 / DSM 74 / LMG 10896 / Claus 1) TaxID=504472 RepID=D2QHL4_SPILD|nr:hypothetical protein Slin_3821 [Spirosoma linguale DSM 74]